MARCEASMGWLFVLVVVALLLALAACSADAKDPGIASAVSGGAPSPTASPSQDQMVLKFVQSVE
jgi:hypothetical protein